MKYGQFLSDESRLFGMASRLENQLQDRRELANQAGREIKIVDCMLAAAKARVAVCDKDIQQQQQQLDAAAEMEEWLRSKYTSVQLYAWMDKQYGMIFQRAYSLANELARQAQRAFFFDLPTEHESFLSEAGGEYWDSARDGMLSAENIWLDLRKMELAYRNKRGHDFELAKNISLRQLDRWALVMFRETGRTTFSLPEFLFDINFPGHYCRRISSVSLAIPCIVRPYASLNCTLRLRQHTYRINTEADSAASYPENPAGDLRFRTDNIPINAIAIGAPTTGATGSFSFGFSDNRYSPFEGAGVISSWQIDLPPELRQFEYRTISDVVLQLRYTALDGGANLKKMATGAVLNVIKQQPSSPAALAMLVNVPNDYASTWYAFQSALQKGNAERLDLPGMSGMLPFWTQRLKITVDSISIIIFSAPNSKNLHLEEIKITEYPSITWEQQNESPDGGSAGRCDVLIAKNVNEGIAQDWTVALPNSGGVKATIDAVWFLVRYYADSQ
ncbi:hypothetical protein G7Y89_g11580 [Cudoniella acicularis]|uniref:Tc toxin complex TcA C-terminal TcB-binding domain-containing protein n=1 Tax=Cudoniella acicularis TaxID=354080 RepID=A0A8H4VXQ9_9HELO|nr:hypothetical protein G7Y89_g11580 [Cudoniella acicularis]